jgi:hypothetical protein
MSERYPLFCIDNGENDECSFRGPFDTERLRERVRELEDERDKVTARESEGVEVFDGIVAEQRATIERLTRERCKAKQRHAEVAGSASHFAAECDRLRGEWANARRTVIDELASDAESLAQDEAYVSWFGVRDWLRSKLDTPTEQPSPDAGPDPIEAAREEGRREEWERCAKVADDQAAQWTRRVMGLSEDDAARCHARAAMSEDIAKRIREEGQP